MAKHLQIDISNFTALTELHISGENCEIVKLFDELWVLLSKLVKLKKFHICNFSTLRTLPDAFQSMVHLEEFSVCGCDDIKIIPSFITLFSKLRVLTLGHLNCLESLPALNTLKMLSILRITWCRLIKKLPKSFTSIDAFPSLKVLDCFGCGLVEFSEVVDGAMPQLQTLQLDYTKIKNLPDSLIYLKNLKEVKVAICVGFSSIDERQFENTCLSGKIHYFLV
jgi:hypothetical protein